METNIDTVATSISDRPSILYVDDEPYNLVSFKSTFRHYYDVFTAINAKEALEILRNHPTIEVIITDQRMPEITGVAFLKTIIHEFSGAVRMILTGYSDIKVVIEAINECKIFHYLTKPWVEAELKQIIDNGILVARLEKHINSLVTQLQDELANKEAVIKTFQKYVPPDVVTRMLSPTENKQLFEGEILVISVLFVDIRDFVKLSSPLTPKQTVGFLNNYFTLMSECVVNRSGTVDKFIGDGLLALFGAPVPSANNPENAVLCALDMLNALKKFNSEYCKQLRIETTIGIGINTGSVVVGNIGSEQYIEYTAIGNTVNLASRIEGLSKTWPNSILISESTYDKVKNFIKAEKLAAQEIKGKENKMDVYKVLGVK
jgi:class 3 adenylate cyclase/CheY-like chemotaxis protein